jgi:hypothetical protein
MRKEDAHYAERETEDVHICVSASTGKHEGNCHFPPTGSKCMIHRKVLQDFLDKSKVLDNKTTKSTYQIKRGADNVVSVHACTLCTI